MSKLMGLGWLGSHRRAQGMTGAGVHLLWYSKSDRAKGCLWGANTTGGEALGSGLTGWEARRGWPRLLERDALTG